MSCMSFSYKIIVKTAYIIAGCFFVMACENDDKVLQDGKKGVVLKEQASNIESYLSQDGKLKAKLTAPLMIRVAGDTISVEFPKKLHCD